MKKFFYVFLSLVLVAGSFFLVPISSAAISVEHDSPYCDISESPTAISTYATLPITYTRMTYYSYQVTPEGDFYENGAYTLGQRITAYYPDYTEIFVINDDGVLFDEPGTLSLMLFAHGNELTITTYFEGGGSNVYNLDPKSFNGSISVQIENYESNIKSIRINLEDHNPGQYVTPTSVLSLDGYSYEVKEFTVFDVLVEFFSTFFDKLSSGISRVLNSFFGDVNNAGSVDAAVGTIKDTENNLLESVGSDTEVVFYDGLFNDSSMLSTIAWIGSLLTVIFYKVKFSVILNITGSLLLASILLGFARHWKDGGK